jgi:hypothetical protein
LFFHDGRGTVVGNVHEDRRTDTDEDETPERERSNGFAAAKIHSDQTEQPEQRGIGNDFGLLKRHAGHRNDESLRGPYQFTDPLDIPHISVCFLFHGRDFRSIGRRNLIVVVRNDSRALLVRIGVERFCVHA